MNLCVVVRAKFQPNQHKRTTGASHSYSLVPTRQPGGAHTWAGHHSRAGSPLLVNVGRPPCVWFSFWPLGRLAAWPNCVRPENRWRRRRPVQVKQDKSKDFRLAQPTDKRPTLFSDSERHQQRTRAFLLTTTIGNCGACGACPVHVSSVVLFGLLQTPTERVNCLCSSIRVHPVWVFAPARQLACLLGQS